MRFRQAQADPAVHPAGVDLAHVPALVVLVLDLGGGPAPGPGTRHRAVPEDSSGASRITCVKAETVAGPMSSPFQPGSTVGTTFTPVVSSGLVATT